MVFRLRRGQQIRGVVLSGERQTHLCELWSEPGLVRQRTGAGRGVFVSFDRVQERVAANGRHLC